MVKRSQPCAVVVFGLSLCICLVWLGCQRERAGGAGEEGLRPVALPGLDGFPESVREQLRSQHARLQTLAVIRRSDAARLGEAYGEMGRLLLAYALDDAAEPALLNAADLAPKAFRWPYYLGYLSQSAGDFESAARHFERALALQPEDGPTRIHLAEVYIQLGREANAKAHLHEAIRIDPRSAAAYFLLGQMAGPEETSEAIAHYETVLRLQPSATVVHYPLARAYRKQGDLERSREHLAQRGDTYITVGDPLLEALQQVKRGPEARMFQGSRLMKQRRYREAAAAFAAAVAEDSANQTAYLNLGVAHAQLGNSDEAIQALQQVLRLDPSNSRAHYNLGRLFVGRGEDKRAFEHLQAAVEGDPSNSTAHFTLANLLWSKRECQEAIPIFETFLAVSPGHVEARLKLAICHAQLAEYGVARKLLEAGYEAFPQEPLLHDAMIRVLAASPDASVRDGDRALKIAERLAAVVPGPETLESLAMAYAEEGRFAEAIQYQQAVIRAAEEQGLTAVLEHLQSNLRRYEQGNPCRTPWPPTVFER